ncbi:hypothetical protein HK101_007684 [Irineochytrium annulatum]|nr:hypothetical protein HK101_007684 [Irineochytrium annulatum]
MTKGDKHKAKAKEPERATASASEAEGEDDGLLEFDEDEQMRIINETGVLHKLKSAKELAEEDEPPLVATSILLAVPLTLFQIVLDYAVHLQYGFEEKFTLTRVATRGPPFFLAMLVIIFVTSKFRNHYLMQALFAITSAAAGCWIVMYSEGFETFGNMLKTPGLACVWVYTVIQMRLDVATASLVVPLGYYFRESLMVFGSGETFNKL